MSISGPSSTAPLSDPHDSGASGCVAPQQIAQEAAVVRGGAGPLNLMGALAAGGPAAVDPDAAPSSVDLSVVLESELGQGRLGHEESTHRFQLSSPGASAEAEITQYLTDRYIDDDDVNARPKDAAAISAAVKNLDYLATGSAEAAESLAAIEAALTNALANPDLELYSLDSRGYGSFGEGNGFAVVNRSSGEVLIALSGYAE